MKEDTDGDGVSDGKEINLGTDPLTYQGTFAICLGANEENTDVKASVDIELTGEQVDSLEVSSVKNNSLFTKNMPGYIGEAYNFHVDGTFDKAKISFEFDESLLQRENFTPTIYYYNETDQKLEALETTVNGHVASATVHHFSTYILADKYVYDEELKKVVVAEWDVSYDNVNADKVNLVLIIDDSGSMTINDKKNERLEVSRNLIDKLPENSKAGIIRFATNIPDLLCEMTDNLDTAKSYLTSSYFKSNGGTYMYNAIEKGFTMWDQTDSNALNLMIVLSDGDTSDTSKHNSVITTANQKGIGIYTVGLGNSTTYFNNYLKPLANSTNAGFYLAADASKLSEIYENISQKIDLNTDSDGDGICDFYEDHLIRADYTRMPLNKNNPDTDGDGLKDGEEITIKLESISEDKVAIMAIMKSDPTLEDTDDDGLLDNSNIVINGKVVAPKDPDPLVTNGKVGMWKAHINASKSYVAPDEYCNCKEESFEESSIINDLMQKIPQDKADIIVEVLAKLNKKAFKDSKDTKEKIYKAGKIIKLIYTIGDIAGDIKGYELDEILGSYILNFKRDDKHIAYHSQPDTWQRKFGYQELYDNIFDAGNTKMVTSTPLEFQCNNEKYAIWMWKGDYYNLHSGCEIGLYKYKETAANSDLYDAIDFCLPMTLNLYYYKNKDKIDHVFSWAPKEEQWWITGFNTSLKYEDPGYTWLGLFDNIMISIGTIDFKGREEMYNALKIADESGDYPYDYFIFDEDGHTVWIINDKVKNN